MPWHQILEAGIIIFLGSILQGAIGFGIGLFSIPIMVWAGIGLPATIAIVTVASGLQTGWSWQRTRDHLPWRDPVPITIVRLLAMPLGIVALGVLSGQGQGVAKQVVGAAIIVILAAQWIFQVKPRQHLAPAWMWVAGLSSGFLTGMISMGGPPLVMWVMAHDWPGRRARAFLWESFLIATPFMMALLGWQFGRAMIIPMLFGAILTPLIVAGSAVGLRVGAMMNRVHLRFAMTILLLIIAVTSLVRV